MPSTPRIVELKARLACLSHHETGSAPGRFTLGMDRVDAHLDPGPCLFCLHDIHAETSADAVAANAFALGLMMRAAQARPLVWVFQNLAVQEVGGLDGSGLHEWGLRPESVLVVRVRDATAMLSAGEEALKSGAAGAVLMTGWGEAIDRSLIGQSVTRIQSANTATRIAVMDGSYAGLAPTQTASATLTGNLFQRARTRAAFIVDHARARYGLKARDRVILVGVVGEIIYSFAEHGIEVIAYDLDADLVGQNIAQTTIQNGALLGCGMPEASLVLATGMTIWNHTLQPLVTLSQQTRTPVALFAETGAHLAPFLIPLGVDSVFSEPFPFYVFGSTSVINFYNHPPKEATFNHLIGQ